MQVDPALPTGTNGYTKAKPFFAGLVSSSPPAPSWRWSLKARTPSIRYAASWGHRPGEGSARHHPRRPGRRYWPQPRARLGRARDRSQEIALFFTPKEIVAFNRDSEKWIVSRDRGGASVLVGGRALIVGGRVEVRQHDRRPWTPRKTSWSGRRMISRSPSCPPRPRAILGMRAPRRPAGDRACRRKRAR